jgi:hypothetical protein
VSPVLRARAQMQRVSGASHRRALRARAGALRGRWAPLLLAACLSGCVVVPQTRTVYHEACRVEHRQMTLDVAVIGRFESCRTNDCAAQLVGAGALVAVSAVVSGSIALVGNVVYWVELQGRCNRGAALAPAAAAPAAPAGQPVANTPVPAAAPPPDPGAEGSARWA